MIYFMVHFFEVLFVIDFFNVCKSITLLRKCAADSLFNTFLSCLQIRWRTYKRGQLWIIFTLCFLLFNFRTKFLWVSTLDVRVVISNLACYIPQAGRSALPPPLQKIMTRQTAAYIFSAQLAFNVAYAAITNYS